MRSSKLFHRRPARHPARMTCQVVRERDFTLVADRVENISTWGMLVGPADPVLTGESVFVTFRIPGTDDFVDACATVKRVVHGRRPLETTRMLGLEFEEMCPYDRYRLRKALGPIPVAPPGHRPGRRIRQVSLKYLAA